MASTAASERSTGRARKRVAQAREQELAELGAAFRRVFRGLSRLRGRDTHLAEGELSHAQLELLSELQDRGGLPAGELAAAARLTPATVTQMLDHLAASGHVERVRSEDDRRVVVSRLTPQGAARIEAKRAAWKERWESALQGVSEAELRSAAEVLARIAAMLEEPPAQAREGVSQAPRKAAGEGLQPSQG